MRVIDHRYRLFGLVNPVDLLVLATCAVAALVVANLLFGIFDTGDAEFVDVEFEVVALGVREFEPGQVAVGDELHSAIAGRLGQVVAVDAYPAQIEVLGPDGVPVTVESALETDVRLTIRGQGMVDALGYRVGGVRIQSNSRIDVATPGFEAQRAYVSYIEAVDGVR